MATQRDREGINRQYPSGPDGPRIDDAIRFVRDHPWGNGKDEKPQVAWPKRDFYDSDESYIISMLKQLFVEMEKINAKLDHPLYQITMPPIEGAIEGAKSGLMSNPPVGNTFDPFEEKP